MKGITHIHWSKSPTNRRIRTKRHLYQITHHDKIVQEKSKH